MIRFCPKSRKYIIDGRTWATATLTATLTATATATATRTRTHHDTAVELHECEGALGRSGGAQGVLRG